MYRVEEVYDLKRKYRNCTTCDDLTNSIMIELYKGNMQVLQEKLSDNPIEAIKISVENNGICFVGLANPNFKTIFQHYFVLFNTQDGIIRLESYRDSNLIIYGPRIVEWPTYLDDMTTLLNQNPGIERLNYYNGLFNAKELLDSDSPISIDVNLITYQD